MPCINLACISENGCIEPFEGGCQDGQVLSCTDGQPVWISGNLELTTADACFPGGIGADYMLREANIVGNTLTLNSAPEHHAVTTTVFHGGRAFPQGTVPVADLMGIMELTTQLNNPSPCREMVGVVNFGAPQFFVTKPLGDANMFYASYMTVEIDGVAIDNIPSRTDAAFDVSNGANFQLSIDTQTMPYIIPFTIPAGGNVQFRSTLNILVLQPNANGVLGLGVRRITAWGMTR